MRMMMKAKLGLIITAMSTVVGIFPKQTKITKKWEVLLMM